MTTKNNNNSLVKIDCQKTFGFNSTFEINAFKNTTDLVPTLDENYIFDPITTSAILAGFKFNQRVLIQGMHGTG